MPICEHLVQFYGSDNELLESVVPYLAEGLDTGEAVLVIAGHQHRRAFEAELAARGVDVEGALADGSYVAVDAAQLLECIRPEDRLLPDTFDEVIGGLVGGFVRRRLTGRRPLRVYGEVVALLWDEGDTEAAAELEQMWNRLRDRERFTLLCTYPTPRQPAQLQALRQVCGSHSSVVPLITPSAAAPVGPDLVAEFDPDLEAPRHVRALLRSALAEMHVDDDLIEWATLAASELAANAVLHARTPFRLLVQARASSVWVAVEDRVPLRDRHEVLGRTPHGLALIAAFALRWGVTPRNNGKIVWAELPLHDLATPAGHTRA